MGMTDSKPCNNAIMEVPGRINFFDLPAELRDMIYAYFPYQAFIPITQAPSKLQQPATAYVSRRMRREALAVFYARNRFTLDLRGWKDPSYPKLWTPAKIFEAWITAIGDTNAGSLRSLIFHAANFRVNFNISTELPITITWSLRTNLTRAETAERVPSDYTFPVATKRAKSALDILITSVQTRARNQNRRLTSEDIDGLCAAVSGIQPFLCTRVGLGFQDAMLEREDMHVLEWPDLQPHMDKCDDCGYLRYQKL